MVKSMSKDFGIAGIRAGVQWIQERGPDEIRPPLSLAELCDLLVGRELLTPEQSADVLARTATLRSPGNRIQSSAKQIAWNDETIGTATSSTATLARSPAWRRRPIMGGVTSKPRASSTRGTMAMRASRSRAVRWAMYQRPLWAGKSP